MREHVGGKLHGAWFAFGEYDFVTILELPDNESMSAFALAVAAGGALRSGKTTPLMAIDEGLAAMKKAGATSYRPPGK